jgi:hypothetical protein
MHKASLTKAGELIVESEPGHAVCCQLQTKPTVPESNYKRCTLAAGRTCASRQSKLTTCRRILIMLIEAIGLNKLDLCAAHGHQLSLFVTTI